MYFESNHVHKKNCQASKTVAYRGCYFLPAQPQPEDFLSSFFCMVPVSAHSGHFFGLHLPSLVAPHFSHLNTAILKLLGSGFSFKYIIHPECLNSVPMMLGGNNNQVNLFCQPFDNFLSGK
jgi:hypothetical protein